MEKADERKEKPGKDRSAEVKKSTGRSPSSRNSGPSPSAGKTETQSLIYEESNRNRVGWLMPDETIPE